MTKELRISNEKSRESLINGLGKLNSYIQKNKMVPLS